jgi:hypothetical protein
MSDGLSRRPPGGRARRPFEKGRPSDSAGGGTGRGNEENATANALTEREAEALIRKAVEPALLGTSISRRDFAADVLQMQPSRIAHAILDCSFEVERIDRGFGLRRTIVTETGHPGARPARHLQARAGTGRGE